MSIGLLVTESPSDSGKPVSAPAFRRVQLGCLGPPVAPSQLVWDPGKGGSTADRMLRDHSSGLGTPIRCALGESDCSPNVVMERPSVGCSSVHGRHSLLDSAVRVTKELKQASLDPEARLGLLSPVCCNLGQGGSSRRTGANGNLGLVDDSVRKNSSVSEVDDEILVAESSGGSRLQASDLQREDIEDVQLQSRAGVSLAHIWLRSRSVNELLSYVEGHIVGSMWAESTITEDDLKRWDTEAAVIVDEMAAFLSTPREEDLVHLDEELLGACTASMNSIGLDATIQQGISALQWRGSPREVIEEELSDFAFVGESTQCDGRGSTEVHGPRLQSQWWQRRKTFSFV